MFVKKNKNISKGLIASTRHGVRARRVFVTVLRLGRPPTSPSSPNRWQKTLLTVCQFDGTASCVLSSAGVPTFLKFSIRSKVTDKLVLQRWIFIYMLIFLLFSLVRNFSSEKSVPVFTHAFVLWWQVLNRRTK